MNCGDAAISRFGEVSAIFSEDYHRCCGWRQGDLASWHPFCPDYWILAAIYCYFPGDAGQASAAWWGGHRRLAELWQKL
jgi:hypothetical protein